MAGAVVLSLLLALLLSACGAVDIPQTHPSAADRAACKALVADIPHRVSERARRDAKGNPLGAAWGDPAIVLRCGVGKPEGYDRFARCQTVDGVDWFAPEDQLSDQGADVVLTTIGRRPDVEVVVPAEYRPPDAVMVDLADVIKKHTKVASRCS